MAYDAASDGSSSSLTRSSSSVAFLVLVQEKSYSSLLIYKVKLKKETAELFIP